MKKTSPMRQMIRDSLKEMKEGNFPEDPKLDEESEITGPERFAKTQKQKDEVVIDRLLAPIAGKAGYFLKLKKELRPGEWMLMKTVENEWRQWADMETAVANIVKDHTKKSPGKWGTGPYKIEYACSGGVRGENYPEQTFFINAEEEFTNPAIAGVGVVVPAVDPSTAVAGQIDTLANLVNMLKNFLPQAIDPAKTQEQIASAFTQGMQLKVGEGSSSTALMSTMMTGLIGMMTAIVTKDNSPKVINPSEGTSPTDGLTKMLEVLKNFGVIGNQSSEKQKTTIDFIRELKELGMDLFKKDDPLDQVDKLKKIASIASEFIGMGGDKERPGVLEKIVDILGPSIPGMVKDFKEASTNMTQAQIEAGRNIDRAQNKMIGQPQPAGNTMNVGGGGSVPTGSGSMPPMSAQVQQFFNGLYDAVQTNNRMFYPIIYTSLLQDPQGQTLLNGIVQGTHTAKDIIEMLQTHGGERYRESEFVMKKLVGYTNGFIIWIREMLKPGPYGIVDPIPAQPGPVTNGAAKQETGHENVKAGGSVPGSYDAECPICHAVYAFEDEQAYREEKEKVCGMEHNGVPCPGMIQPISQAAS